MAPGAYVEDALAVAPDEPCAWLGHSFGGRLAFEVAAAAPEPVERLVLLDPAIRIPPHVGLCAAEKARRGPLLRLLRGGHRPPLRGERADDGARASSSRRSCSEHLRPSRGRSLPLPLLPERGGRGLRRDDPRAAAVRARPHPDAARARRDLVPALRLADRRALAPRSASCCGSTASRPATRSSGTRSTRPPLRSRRFFPKLDLLAASAQDRAEERE